MHGQAPTCLLSMMPGCARGKVAPARLFLCSLLEQGREKGRGYDQTPAEAIMSILMMAHHPAPIVPQQGSARLFPCSKDGEEGRDQMLARVSTLR